MLGRKKLKAEIESLKIKNDRLQTVIGELKARIRDCEKEERIWKWVIANPPIFFRGQTVGQWKVVSFEISRERIGLYQNATFNLIIGASIILVAIFLKGKKEAIAMIREKLESMDTRRDVYSYLIMSSDPTENITKTVSEVELVEIQVKAEEAKQNPS